MILDTVCRCASEPRRAGLVAARGLASALAVSSLGSPLLAAAQPAIVASPPAATVPDPQQRAQRSAERMAEGGAPWSDRARLPGYRNEKKQLESELMTGTSLPEYRSIIARNGYAITSINRQDDGGVEYEVVRDGDSYEVSIALGPDGSAADIEVSDNEYRALETERERVQQALPLGQPVDDYATMLRGLGYEITSVNDREREYVEWEIVRGLQSFEIQMERHPQSRLVTGLDVTSNLWRSDATQAALLRNEETARIVGREPAVAPSANR